MCRAVFFAHKVHVIGGHDLDSMLLRKGEDLRAILLLTLIQVKRHPGHLGLVKHHLEIIILSEYPLVPLDGLVHAFRVAGQYPAGYLPRHAG